MLARLQPDRYDELLDRKPSGVAAQLDGLTTEGGTSMHHYCGERALLEAVLREAILCVNGQGKPLRDRDKLAREARRWIMSRARNWLFAFESVCDVLDIDPGYLRRKLLRLESASAAAGSKRSPAAEELVRKIRIIRMRGNQHPRKLYRRPPRRRG
jgi:hypothetical protein